MTYKLIIAGGRDFDSSVGVKEGFYLFLLDNGLIEDSSNAELSNYEIVSGGARGADRAGEFFAERHDIGLRIFKADWDKHGRKAGVLRNISMADYADGLLAFWDGKSKGTKHMIETAKKKGLTVKVILYNHEEEV